MKALLAAAALAVLSSPCWAASVNFAGETTEAAGGQWAFGEGNITFDYVDSTGRSEFNGGVETSGDGYVPVGHYALDPYGSIEVTIDGFQIGSFVREVALTILDMDRNEELTITDADGGLLGFFSQTGSIGNSTTVVFNNPLAANFTTGQSLIPFTFFLTSTIGSHTRNSLYAISEVKADIGQLRNVGEVPLPAAAWLFGSVMVGAGLLRRRRQDG